MQYLIQFLRFARFHTIIGTSLSLTTLYVLALAFAENGDLHLADFGWTLLSCLGANVYIVGLNQITDIDIDRINKPYLPLASGFFSLRTGYWLIGISVFISLAIALYYGGYLLLTVLLSLLLGTAYSLPPIRLKRFHFWAAFCIIAVRGLIVNLFLFLHFHVLINDRYDIPTIVWLLTGIIFAYSIVIAWFKDIPDMEGDQAHRIQTLSIRLGAKKVFWIGNIILSIILLGAAISIFLDLIPFATSVQPFALAYGQIVVLIALWGFNFWILQRYEDLFSRVTSWFPKYYQFVWILFFCEYLIFMIAA